MTIQSSDYRTLTAEVDKEFLRGTVGAMEEQINNWEEVANTKNAATGTVFYAQGNNAPAVEPKGATGYSFAEMAINTYKIVSSRFGKGLKISVDDLNDDKFGMFIQIINDLGASAYRLPQRLIWSWLKEGDQTVGPAGTLFAGRDMLGIDGVAFFSASHKVNINDASLSTQSNLLTSTALTAANYEIAREALVSMKDTEGLPIGRQPTHIYVPSRLVKTAADILMAPTISTAGTNVQANDFSVKLKRPQMTIVEVPELAGDTTVWYLAAKGPNGAPVTWQVTEELKLIPHLNPETDSVFYNDIFEWLVKGRVNVGWGDYRRIVRCVA